LNTSIASVAIVVFLAQANACADCPYPSGPGAPPNGATVTQAELNIAIAAVKQFESDIKAYMDCLNGPEYRKAHNGRDVDKLNAASNALQARAAVLNAQIVIYNKLHPKSGNQGQSAFQLPDPNQDFAGRNCAYFTKPLQRRNDDNEVVGLNVHANGSIVGYGKWAYICENRLWKRYGFGDSSNVRHAADVER
jgi:hypothetical protein